MAQASLHFCSECNNLLYPKADPQRRIMVYACRICNYDEIGENKCVYRNDLLTVTKCVPSLYRPVPRLRRSRLCRTFGVTHVLTRFNQRTGWCDDRPHE